MRFFNKLTSSILTLQLSLSTAFAAEVARRLVAKGLGKNDTIFAMCLSGDRSSKAP